MKDNRVEWLIVLACAVALLILLIGYATTAKADATPDKAAEELPSSSVGWFRAHCADQAARGVRSINRQAERSEEYEIRVTL